MFVGGVNLVTREGGLVRRPAGPWSGTVQRLLAQLREAGFTGAPRPYGIGDDAAEELVEYLPGTVGHDFAAPEVRSDASLVAAGRLLRALHDASADFVREPGDVWQFPAREPAEVICHGDAATYNTVFRDGLPVAFIDFDTAHPGPRLWDAAYTAYRFVPLYAPDEVEHTLPVPEAKRRLLLFADSYGLSQDERDRLPATAAERLRALVAWMREQAAAGHPAFGRHVAEGHDRRYLTDARWIEETFGRRRPDPPYDIPRTTNPTDSVPAEVAACASCTSPTTPTRWPLREASSAAVRTSTSGSWRDGWPAPAARSTS